MEEWKKLESIIRDQIILLRQNKDETDSGELVSNLVRTVKIFLDKWCILDDNNENLEECVRRLQDIKEAYFSGDIIFLADVLEYEILDMIVWIEEMVNIDENIVNR